MLTIVMYHYVRDIARSKYPAIKGLSTGDFKGQLDYIARHYNVIDIRDVVRALDSGKPLPSCSCVLTFDDGLIDHYETVFPELAARGMTAAFFPSAAPLREERVLDVHKVQFILASGTATEEIKGELFKALSPLRAKHSFPSDDELYAALAKPNRFDTVDVIFVKRMLQVALPADVRSAVAASLFRRFITDDEPAFARGLYMSITQLREMAGAGMTIGGHGDRHFWLGKLTREEQEAELSAMLEMLENVCGHVPRRWVMSYPSGSYNDDTLALLKASDCALGLTARVALADLSRPLELARLDTNDLPREASAPPCRWTVEAKKDGNSRGCAI